VSVLAASAVPVVIMFARNRGPRAERAVQPHQGLIEEISAFFRGRLAALAAAGIAAERVILDPGMGLFLGSTPQPSLLVLRRLEALAALGRPLYVSTSRKSFIGGLLGRPAGERQAGTLASELWAAQRGAAYVRTHDVRALAEAWRVWQAIEQAPDQ
jgi:dihydropteroate synthase type 2